MFEKLLANLPYNPELRKQVGFYVRSLRHEESVRLTGLVFIVLAFVVQLIAVTGSPQPISANSGNDVRTNAGISGQAVLRQSAANVTQKISDASDKTSQPNDVIVYTLFAENRGQAEIKNFIMRQDIGDVLDYAEVVSLHGGRIINNNIVRWDAAAIQSGSTMTNKLTVRIKNPMPTAKSPTDNPTRFDYEITSAYGNSVDVKLALPNGVSPLVSLSSNESFPQTTAAEGLVLAGAAVIVAGYFLARARLLVDESLIVTQQTKSGSI